MVWPCQHMLAWADEIGQNPGRLFHKCWRTSSLRMLYDSVLPSFITTHLMESPCCLAPQAAVSTGRHRMVRIEQASLARALGNGEDLHRDPEGSLCLRYPIDDDNEIVTPFPGGVTSMGVSVMPGSSRKRVRSTSNSTTKCTCSRCGEQGHNRRTCKASIEAETTAPTDEVLPCLLTIAANRRLTLCSWTNQTFTRACPLQVQQSIPLDEPPSSTPYPVASWMTEEVDDEWSSRVIQLAEEAAENVSQFRVNYVENITM